MSKLILSNLVQLSNRTLKLNNIICSRNLTLNNYQARRTLAFKSDRLLKNLLKLNQTSFRFIESDKKSDKKIDDLTGKEKNENQTELAESVDTSSEKSSKQTRAHKEKTQFHFSWKTLGISSIIGLIYFGCVQYLWSLKEHEWEMDRKKTLGKAAIGGEFELVDTNNKPVSSKDFHGKWCLIYFGFSHCPDVCPEEIEKMIKVYERVKGFKLKDEIVPIFISVDPDRDTPEIVKKYCAEFSPDIIGLTGNKEQVKKTCKSYRVYYSAGPKSVDKDYIVDHTIIMYLINPDGEFVDYYGQTRDAEMITNAIIINMNKYNKAKKGSWFG